MYAFGCQRICMLTQEKNDLQMKITNLNEMKRAMANKGANYQRLMNYANAMQTINEMWNGNQSIFGNSGTYSSPEYNNAWEKYFWPYAQCYLTESDIDTQLKQLETQYQAVQEQLKQEESRQKQDIQSETGHYGVGGQ